LPSGDFLVRYFRDVFSHHCGCCLPRNCIIIYWVSSLSLHTESANSIIGLVQLGPAVASSKKTLPLGGAVYLSALGSSDQNREVAVLRVVQHGNCITMQECSLRMFKNHIMLFICYEYVHARKTCRDCKLLRLCLLEWDKLCNTSCPR